jgi:hypothetical protein
MRAGFFQERRVGLSLTALFLAAFGLLAEPVAGQSCTRVVVLLQRGFSADEITRLSNGQLRDCALQLRSGFSAAGPLPRGAPGPAPHGAASPAPSGGLQDPESALTRRERRSNRLRSATQLSRRSVPVYAARPVV